MGVTSFHLGVKYEQFLHGWENSVPVQRQPIFIRGYGGGNCRGKLNSDSDHEMTIQSSDELKGNGRISMFAWEEPLNAISWWVV